MATTDSIPIKGTHSKERDGVTTCDEAELLVRVRAGDERACACLVRQYGGAMLTVARRFLRCEYEAADAVQEAFVSALRFLHTFNAGSKLGTWLHRIVVNVCLMKLRSRRGKEPVSIEALMPAFDASGRHDRPIPRWSDAVEQLDAAERRAQVRACIDRLPEPYRAVLLLRDIEELDTEDTARRLGMSVANVKTRLHRARLALRALLEPYFEDDCGRAA